MNKQAFTFLTLFTLVLLLGVYYVTLPADSGSISPDALISSVQSDLIEQYTEEKKQTTDDLKRQNEQIISSSVSTSEEKLEALEKNAVLSAKEQFETQISDLLKEQGIESCFVEKNDQIVRVVLPEQYSSQTMAVNVMKWILEMSSEELLVEVSFE